MYVVSVRPSDWLRPARSGSKSREVTLCHSSVVTTDMRTKERKVAGGGERAKVPVADMKSVVMQHLRSEKQPLIAARYIDQALVIVTNM